MRSILTRVATLASLIALPFVKPAVAQSTPAAPVRAHAVVERLLQHRLVLTLDSAQVAQLARLAERLRSHPTRLRVVGQRTPGKAGPRVERRLVSPEEALRAALGILTPDQRSVAVRITGTDTTRTAQR